MTLKPDKKEQPTYRDSLNATCKARYLQKLSEINNKDPYEIGKGEWVSDVDTFPAVLYPDIVNYLVNSVSAYTLDEMKAYKSLEAYNYFVCGWVQEIRQTTVNNKCIVIGRVRHSQRSTEPCSIPWIVAETNGIVVSGHCTCMAGLGEACSHVSALLFAVEAMVRMRDNKTVTQEKSHLPLSSAIKKVSYKTVQDINFTSAKTLKRQLDSAGGDTRKTRKLTHVQEPTQDELARFYTALTARGKKPVLLSIIPGFAKLNRPAALDKKYLEVLSELNDNNLGTTDKETVLNH